MALLTVIAVLLSAAALCFVFYNQLSGTVRADIRERAELFRHTDYDAAKDALSGIVSAEMRVTVVAPDGEVLYDNAAPANTMENHGERDEIKKALEIGFGESKRVSPTLGKETFYFAVRLPDGNVLRMAKTTESIYSIFGRALPVVAILLLAIIVIGYVAAVNLTRRIIKPINSVRLEAKMDAPYDELAPFVRAIETQRAQIAAQLADLRERGDTINAIIENMNEGAILIDAEGTVLSANKSAMRIFGAGANAAGKNIRTVFRDVTLLEFTNNALAGHSGETAIRRGDRDYQAYFSPVAGSGAILLFLDTTERAKSEKLRREFSANVSHELKTPLTSISACAEMLENGMVKEADRLDFIKKIKDESNHLINLVEDIMLISRLDEREGTDAFEFKEVALSAVAAAAAEMLKMKASETDICLEVEQADICVRANPAMMSELFFNLIDNAIKYNKPGGSVKVSFAREGGRVSATVSDTGIGIPEEAQGRVFERFYRADASRFKKTGGTGLGLAIVKHIAIIHGAELALSSRVGAGTEISVIFAAAHNPD